MNSHSPRERPDPLPRPTLGQRPRAGLRSRAGVSPGLLYEPLPNLEVLKHGNVSKWLYRTPLPHSDHACCCATAARLRHDCGIRSRLCSDLMAIVVVRKLAVRLGRLLAM